jgi:NitT/TauT family transport system substrate-binding protein
MKSARFAAVVSAAFSLLVFAGGASPLGAQSTVTLRVGAAPLDSNGPLYYAQDLGYFKDAGITLEFAGGLNNAAAALAALAGGAVDISAASLTSIAAAHDAGLDFKIVAASQTSDAAAPGEVLMVRTGAPEKTPADLQGKTIGIIGIKSLMQVAAMSWIDRHGGDSKSLKFVEIPVPQMCSQLTAGRVDAAVMVEPFATSCTDARPIGNVDDGIAPRFLVTGFVANGAWLDAHRDVATRFAAAIAKAAAWGNAHPVESAAILVKYSHLDPAVAAAMKRAHYGTEVVPAIVQPVIDASIRYGAISRTLSAGDIIWAH